MAKKKKNHYTSNAYLVEIINRDRARWQKSCHNNPDVDPVQYISNELAHSITLICNRLGTRANFRHYTYNDDMVAEAIFTCLRGALKYDCEKSNNAFAYLSQIAWNSFITTLNKEKKVRDIRDKILIENGMEASWTAQNEHAEEFHIHNMDINEEKMSEESEDDT